MRVQDGTPIAGNRQAGADKGGPQAPATCRVTVVCGSAGMDLLLPAQLPVADLLPTVLRLLAPRGERGVGARSWSLAPPGADALDSAATLDAGGIRDGDLLLLLAAAVQPPAPVVVDVRSAVEAWADADEWTARRAAGFLAWVVAVIALALVPLATITVSPAALLPVTLLVSAGLASVAVAVRTAAPGVSIAAVTVLGVCCGVAVGATSHGAGWLPGCVVAAGFAAAAVPTFLLRPWQPGAVAVAVAFAVPAVGAALVAATAAGGLPILAAVRGIGLAAVCAIGAVPRSAVAMGGLLGMDERHRRGPPLRPRDVDQAAGRAERVTSGLLAGLGGTVACAAAVLSLSTSPWDTALAGLLGATVLARSRIASRGRHVLILWVTSLASLGIACAVLVTRMPFVAPVLLSALLVLGAAVVMATAARHGWTGAIRARLSQAAGVADRMLPAAALVVAAGGCGLYGWTGAALAGLG